MHEHRFTPDKAAHLISDDRKQQLPADKIMDMMELKKGNIVADLGAGNGFFTIPMAQRTREAVYAVDVEPQMLEKLKERGAAAEVDNIRYVQNELENIPIDDHSVDKVLISFVLHEVPDMVKTLDEIKRILKPSGTVLFLEWEAVETEDGPPFHIRIPSSKLEEALQNRGFETTTWTLNEGNYAVRAR